MVKVNVDLTQNLIFASHSPDNDFFSALIHVTKPWEFKDTLILVHNSTDLLKKNRIPWNSIKSNINLKYYYKFHWNFNSNNFSQNSSKFPWDFGLKNSYQNFRRFPWNF